MRLQQFAQKAFIRDADRLLVLQKSEEDPHNPGRWEVPGGRMAFGEEVDAHLIREVREETGLDVEPGAPFFIWQWVMQDIRPGSDDEIQVISVARECTAVSTGLSATDQEETDFIGTMRWVKLEDFLALDLIPSLRPAATAYCGHLAA